MVSSPLILPICCGGQPAASPAPHQLPPSPLASPVSFFSLSRPSHSRSSSLQRHHVRQLQLGLDQAQKGHSGDGEKPLASAACRCCRARLSYSVAPAGDALPSYCGSTSMAASSVGSDLFRLNDTSTSTNIASSS